MKNKSLYRRVNYLTGCFNITSNGEQEKIQKLKSCKELQNALKELDYMEKHPEEYKTFHSVKELMDDLNSDS